MSVPPEFVPTQKNSICNSNLIACGDCQTDCTLEVTRCLELDAQRRRCTTEKCRSYRLVPQILVVTAVLAGFSVMVGTNILTSSQEVTSSVKTILRSAAHTVSGLVKCMAWSLLLGYDISGSIQSVYEKKCFDGSGQGTIHGLAGTVNSAIGVLCVSAVMSFLNVVM